MLVVGAATRDVLPGDQRGWRLGGGVSYGAMTAARLGASVRALIGVDEEAASAEEIETLRGAGVDVRLARLRRGPVMENRQTEAGRLQLVSQASDELLLAALPAAWLSAQAVLLAPVAGELSDAWAAAFARPALVGLAWQGLLRRLEVGRPIQPLPLRSRPLIARADLALVSADDIRSGVPPLEKLLGPGQQLVISRGERGGLHAERTPSVLRWREVPAIAAVDPLDSTGAGDCFLAAWFTALLASRETSLSDAWRSLAVATAMASLSVRGSGIGALPGLSEVCRLLHDGPATMRLSAG